jgi:hypothetical protein
LEGSRLVTAINLIKALGCGWQATNDSFQMPKAK